MKNRREECSSLRIDCVLSRIHRRKQTWALLGSNLGRDTSEQAGKRPLHSVEEFLRRCLHFERLLFLLFICPAHA